MASHFEFTQLLRAYRRGVISEAVFAQEVAAMGNSSEATRNTNTDNTNGFKALGKIYAKRTRSDPGTRGGG